MKVFKIFTRTTINHAIYEESIGFFVLFEETHEIKGYTDNELIHGYYNEEAERLSFIRLSKSIRTLLYRFDDVKQNGTVLLYSNDYRKFCDFACPYTSSSVTLSIDDNMTAKHVLDTFRDYANAATIDELTLLYRSNLFEDYKV